MSEGRSCQTCSFHAPIARECRRNAPTAVTGSGPQGLAVIGVFPATRPENWCGEYKPAMGLGFADERRGLQPQAHTGDMGADRAQ